MALHLEAGGSLWCVSASSAELPDIRWHDLRHSCSTILLARGTNPKYVQHLTGHAGIRLTLDRCSHWIPSMGHHAADGMDEALG
jgi:integrase